MTRKIVRLTPGPPRGAAPRPAAPACSGSATRYAAAGVDDPAAEKEAWVSEVLREWGSCGRVALVDDEPVGYVDLRARGVRARARPASRPRRSRRTRCC